MCAVKTQDITKQEESMPVRFMNKVVTEFNSTVGDVALTQFQKRLAQNYFIAIDSVLAVTEEKRKKKGEQHREPLPVVWANVNMQKLARDVVAAARVGLDPAQPNHINLIPYKNNSTNKYDIGFIDGYRGIELKATKYGLDIPDDVTVELVYSKDKFKPIKKDRNNQVESYEFEVVNAFDRGEIVGGFYYHSFQNTPIKNKLVVFTLNDILKRRPEYASVEFWGGEKDEYKNGNKTGKKIQVPGWYEKMCYKTIYRAAYRDITIDSQKIDDDYLLLKQAEDTFVEQRVAEEIKANANSEHIDVEYIVDEDGEEEYREGPEDEPRVIEDGPADPPPPKRTQRHQGVGRGSGQQMIDTGGPGF
ncbi:MAG TPA: recombinase RecT [Dissulfurispiraceae bacterium]|nr:recombinase RecT [Dissulfurispiraceae bacterium]